MSLINKISMTMASIGVGFTLVFAGVAAVPVLATSHDTTCDPTSGSIKAGIDCSANSDLKDQTLFGANGGLFEKITNILLFLVGAISVIMLIIGGIRYVVSAGDQNAVTGAKNTILYAIIGVVVALISYAAIDFILSQFAAN